jgi:TonB family protein
VEASPPPPDEGLRGLAPQSADQVVRALTAETVGRGKVARGLVHSWYGELGKALLRHWDADRAVSQRGLSGYFEQTKDNSRNFRRIWMERAHQYGASGNPLDEQGESLANEGRAPPSVSPSLEARRAVRRQVRQEFRATKKATVRVVQDAQGRLLTAELVSPSNDAQVDREALADVRGAAQQLPAPPAEVLAGREHLVSLWQFELIVSISPPVPTMRFEFDEALGFIDTRLPLDRRIYKRVRLLQVE